MVIRSDSIIENQFDIQWEDDAWSSRKFLGVHQSTEVYYDRESHGLVIKEADKEAAVVFDSSIIATTYAYKPNILYLKVTEQCNLNCSYCYERNIDHSVGRRAMDLQTAIKAINNYIINRGHHELNVCFFGGEPLLNYSLIRDIIVHFQIIPFVKIGFAVTTNGTLLTKEMTDFFI